MPLYHYGTAHAAAGQTPPGQQQNYTATRFCSFYDEEFRDRELPVEPRSWIQGGLDGSRPHRDHTATLG
jgi:hypothetical protein